MPETIIREIVGLIVSAYPEDLEVSTWLEAGYYWFHGTGVNHTGAYAMTGFLSHDELMLHDTRSAAELVLMRMALTK